MRRLPIFAILVSAVARHRLMGHWNARVARAVALGCLFGVGVMLFGAQSALADSAAITITDTTGNVDPAAGVPRVFTLSGTASVPEIEWVRYRPSGGAPCGPTVNSDSGTLVNLYGQTVDGNFTLNTAVTWSAPGSYLFCTWLSHDSNAVTTPFSQTIVFRAPTGSIGATLNPAQPTPKSAATITVSGASEAPEYVFATYHNTGSACAVTFSTDTGADLINGSRVNGSYSIPVTQTFDTAGSYTLCLWLASSSSDAAPIAGPQTVPFTVAGGGRGGG
jgi:hypothetical protein